MRPVGARKDHRFDSDGQIKAVRGRQTNEDIKLINEQIDENTMTTKENIIKTVVDICKQFVAQGEDPSQVIACLMGACGTLVLDYDADLDYTTNKIEEVLSELEEKFKDHPNFRLVKDTIIG
jgi:inosine/xanthosine triphosphate pyrophosphatase family protein